MKSILRLGVVVGVFWLAGVLHAAPFVVGTFNVRNYTAADRMTDDGFRPEYPKPELEKQAVRAVIRAAAADVMVLQEMGPAPYLEELRRDLRAEGLDYAFAYVLEGGDPDRHVAVLARKPPRTVVPHVALRFMYFKEPDFVKRGLLELTFQTGSGEVTLFAFHLKSRLTERPDDPFSSIRREAEAIAIRDQVLTRFPDPAGARFLLLGDCNDPPGSRTVDRLVRRGATEIATLVPASDSRDERWTYYYKAEDSYTRVDNVLVSPGLAGAVTGKGRIIDIPAALVASDHRAVVVRFEL